MRSFKYYVITLIRVVLDTLSELILRIKFRKPAGILPVVTNPILTETAVSLALKIRKKQVSSEEVVKAFIERIEKVNPLLNAAIQTNFEGALKEARNVDELLKFDSISEEELSKTKPFLGVPFTIKDSFGVKRFKQACGSYLRKDIVADKDAEVVTLMKNAGAIFLAMTNVPEFCMWVESSNNIYGQSNNPFDFNRTPGGSSGGEASIVSASGSPLGIGTDVGGSIRIPALFTGIFGHKTSPLVVSLGGKFPASPKKLETLSVCGPMSRFATDLRPMLKVMAGPNASMLTLDKKVNMNALKIYYVEELSDDPALSPVDSELKAAQQKVLDYFKNKYGSSPIQMKLDGFNGAWKLYFDVMGSTTDLPSYWSSISSKSDQGIWYEVMKKILGQSNHKSSSLLYALINKQCRGENTHSIEEIEKLKTEFQELLGTDGVLIFPSHPRTAPYHHKYLVSILDITYTSLFNMLEVPSTQCPLGLAKNGLPMGIQVISNRNQDHICLSIAEELEAAFGGWVSPSIIDRQK